MTHRCHLENSAARFAADVGQYRISMVMSHSRASSAGIVMGELVCAPIAREARDTPSTGSVTLHPRLYANACFFGSLVVSPLTPRLLFSREHARFETARPSLRAHCSLRSLQMFTIKYSLGKYYARFKIEETKLQPCRFHRFFSESESGS